MFELSEADMAGVIDDFFLNYYEKSAMGK